MKMLEVEITGGGMLLQHNVRLANPMDSITKSIGELHKQMKRKGADKEAIREEIAELEFKGGIYFDADNKVCLPARVILATLHEGAKLTRGGQDFLRSVTILGETFPLKHDGPSDFDSLWAKRQDYWYQAMVTIGTSKVLRTRPCFHNWSVTFTVAFNPDGIEEQDLLRYIRDAGLFCGIGDGRSKLQAGRYSIRKVNGVALDPQTLLPLAAVKAA